MKIGLKGSFHLVFLETSHCLQNDINTRCLGYSGFFLLFFFDPFLKYILKNRIFRNIVRKEIKETKILDETRQIFLERNFQNMPEYSEKKKLRHRRIAKKALIKIWQPLMQFFLPWVDNCGHLLSAWKNLHQFSYYLALSEWHCFC